MKTRNTATSKRSLAPRNRIVRALLIGINAVGGGRHSHALRKREQARDTRDIDQRVRDCGEW